MQPSGIRTMRQDWVAPGEAPWLVRFLGKIVLDVLPAALASVIGGFLFTQYHFAQTATSRPAAAEAAPASAEMVAMIRDEHTQIMSYLKAQTAAQRSRDLAADAATAQAAAAARAAADAKLADALIAAQTAARQSSADAARPSPAHSKPPVSLAAAPHAPLVIAQVAQPNRDDAVDGGVAPGDRLARDPDSLFAKTLDLKDHVVAATRQVVSAIGDVFASVGDRIGGALSGGRQFGSAS